MLTLAALVSITSCSSVLTEAQKFSLTTVGVSEHEALAGARQNVRLLGGDTLPLLVGEAVSAGEVNSSGYRADSSHLNKLALPKVSQSIQGRAEQVLKADDFFGSRWSSNADNNFDGEIISYGLVKKKSSKGAAEYLRASIEMRVWLESKNGQRLFTKELTAKSKGSYTVADYTEQPDRVKVAFRQAVDDFESQFAALLEHQSGGE